MFGEGLQVLPVSSTGHCGGTVEAANAVDSAEVASDCQLEASGTVQKDVKQLLQCCLDATHCCRLCKCEKSVKQ